MTSARSAPVLPDIMDHAAVLTAAGAHIQLPGRPRS
jgi:hypothetical protein